MAMTVGEFCLQDSGRAGSQEQPDAARSHPRHAFFDSLDESILRNTERGQSIVAAIKLLQLPWEPDLIDSLDFT